MHEFEWFLDRLTVAKWEDESAGARSAFFNCPVHSGSDSLHVTEKNGKALVKCFGCGASYRQVVDTLETGETAGDADVRSAPRARAVRRRRLASSESTGGAEGSTPSRAHQDPLEWTARRCAMARQELEDLGLPLSYTADGVAFVFAGTPTIKIRQVGEGKKKDIAWVGSSRPELWPVPTRPEARVVLTEGEFDTICLINSGFDAYSVTAGAGTETSVAFLDALRARGVSEVWIAFDLDRDGRRGRDKLVEAARASGLAARPVKPVGIDVLSGEKDVRDVAVRLGYPIELEDDASEDEAVSIREVTLAPPEPLLLDWLHPYEHTVLFGDGGTGKGVVAAWWAAQLVRQGMKVLVVDYEQHARHEWRPRLQRFFCAHEEFHREPLCPEADALLDGVYYVQPIKPIWDIASWIAGQAARVGADYLIIDSVTFATAGSDPSEASTAIKYLQAVNIIGYPVLSLAHVTKIDADPKHPFGSVHWHNGARITIGISARDEKRSSDRILKHRKANQGQQHEVAAVRWEWVDYGLPPALGFDRAWTSDQQALELFRDAEKRDPTSDEMTEMIGKRVTDATLRKMIDRSRDRGSRSIGVKRVKRDYRGVTKPSEGQDWTSTDMDSDQAGS